MIDLQCELGLNEFKIDRRYVFGTNLVSLQCTSLVRSRHSNRASLFDWNGCSKNRRHFPSSVLRRSTVYRSICKLERKSNIAQLIFDFAEPFDKVMMMMMMMMIIIIIFFVVIVVIVIVNVQLIFDFAEPFDKIIIIIIIIIIASSPSSSLLSSS